MTAPEIFTLTREEKQSGVWRKLLAHFERLLQSAREQNDHHIVENRTQHLRGEISVLKTLISLNEDHRPITTDDRPGATL